MSIEAILFDKDGVLIDFDRTWGQWGRSFLADLAEGDAALHGRLADALVYDVDSSVFLPSSPLIAGTSDTWLRLIAPVLPDRAPDELIECAVNALKETEVVAPVDLVAVLGELREKGYPLGIATNDHEESARQQMEGLGAVSYTHLTLPTIYAV